MHNASEVTQLLNEIRAGDARAADRIFPLVYEELRRLAQSYMNRESDGQTLQATALVHEAFLRMVDQTRVEWQGRAHFFAVAAQAIRRILVDHARSRRRQKRGSGMRPLPLDAALEVGTAPDVDVIALNDALEAFSSAYPLAARIVELRFFGGLTMQDAAEVLGISVRSAERHWQFARAWLYRELEDS